MAGQIGYDPDKIAELARRLEGMVTEAQSLTGNLIDPHPIAGLPTDRAANQFRKDLDQKLHGQEIEDFLGKLPEALRTVAENLSEAARTSKETEERITEAAREVKRSMSE